MLESVPEYTALAVLSVPVVIALEVFWLRTGVFRRLQYWLAMAIVLGFQVPVDGWLTKLSDPIVIYNEAETTSVRFPWDIPVEDFAFGFSMVTLALLVWVHLGRHDTGARSDPRSASDPTSDETHPREAGAR